MYGWGVYLEVEENEEQIFFFLVPSWFQLAYANTASVLVCSDEEEEDDGVQGGGKIDWSLVIQRQITQILTNFYSICKYVSWPPSSASGSNLEFLLIWKLKHARKITSKSSCKIQDSSNDFVDSSFFF